MNKLHPLIRIAILRLYKYDKFNDDEYKIGCLHFLGFNHDQMHKLLQTNESNRDLSVITFRISRWITTEILQVMKMMKGHKKELL